MFHFRNKMSVCKTAVSDPPDRHNFVGHCDPKKVASENTMRKGENSGNKHFSPFPTVFSSLSLNPK